MSRSHPHLRRALILAGAAAALLPPALVLIHHRYGAEGRLRRLRGEAALAMRLGRGEAAVARLEEARRLDPARADIERDLGQALLLRGDRRGAREAFERAKALDPSAMEPRLSLAALAIDERDTRGAREETRWLSDPARAIRARPYRATIALLDFRIAVLDGDVSAAEGAADEALAIAPRSVPALLCRAALALSKGDAASARALLERRLDVAPRDARLRVLLSQACERTGDPGAARTVLEIEPLSPGEAGELAARRAELEAAARDLPALERVAGALPKGMDPARREYVGGLLASARGDTQAAERGHRRALALEPALAAPRLELAKLLVARDDLAGARAELKVALEDDPLSRAARLELACVSVLAGDCAGAATEAEKLLRVAPRDLEAMRLLVTARAKEGRAAEAERFIADMEARDPGNEIASLGKSLASIAALDTDTAIDGGERLLLSSPTALGALEALAAAYAAKRGLADALVRLDRVARADARFFPLRLDVASVYASLGRLDLAERELREMLQTAPAFAPAHLALGAVLMRRGDLAAAEPEAERALEGRDDDLAARSLLARIAHARGEEERALELAARPTRPPLVGRRAEHALALARTGLAAAVERGLLDRATASFEAARRVDQSLSPAILAAAALALGRDGAAEQALASASRTADADVHWIAAMVDHAAGRRAGALAHAREANAAGSTARSLVLVVLDLEEGLWDDARAAARAAGGGGPPGPLLRSLRELAVRSEPATLSRVADPLFRLVAASTYGFKAPVKGLAERAIREGPDLALTALVASRALSEEGLAAEARSVLEGFLARHPESIPALEELGAELIARRDFDAAANVLGRAIEAAPHEPRVRVMMGLVDEGLGARSAAIAAYREALRIDPESGTAAMNLAGLLVRDSDSIDEALEVAARAQELLPASERALDTLGVAQLLRERTAEALAALTRARALAPHEPRVRVHLARAYRRLKEPDRALAELDMAVLLGPDTAEGSEAARLRDEILTEVAGGRRPGRTLETAARISPGDDVRESLGQRGARHCYGLDPEGPRGVVLRFEGPRDAATRIVLVRKDPRGVREVKVANVPASGVVEWSLHLAAGAFAVEVEASGGTTIASYRLSVATDGRPPPEVDREPNDTLADAEAVTAPADIRARISEAGDRDCFVVQCPEGARLDVRIRGIERGVLSVRLEEARELGPVLLKEVAVAPGSSAAIDALRVGGGKLAIEVSAEGLATGAYAILVTPTARPGRGWLDEPDDEAALAHELARPGGGVPGESAVAGTISPAGDVDLVRLPEGRSSLEIRAPSDLAIAADAVVFPPGEAPRVLRTLRLDAGARARIASLGAPGLVVRIRAQDARASSSQPYEVRVATADETIDLEPNDVPALASPLPSGKGRGLLDCTDDRDCYRIADPGSGSRALCLRALDGPISVAVVGAEGAVRRFEVRPEEPLRVALEKADRFIAISTRERGGRGYEIEIGGE